MKVSPERRDYIIDRLFTYGFPALAVFCLGLGVYHLLFVPGGRSQNGMGVFSILLAILVSGFAFLHKMTRGDYDRHD